MKKIKSIIFDLGAVLLNISYQKTIEEFDKLGIKNSSTFYSKKLQNLILLQRYKNIVIQQLKGKFYTLGMP